MKMKSNCISGPKMEAFLKILPFLKSKYQDNEFSVYDAIPYVNANPDLKVWCHRTRKIDKSLKARKEAEGFSSLDLQNACHCFAGRRESRVVDLATDKTVKLLDQVSDMTFRIPNEQKQKADETNS